MFFLLVGLLLYVFDLGSDIYVAVQYWKNDETWWFGLTTGFIAGPSLVVNTLAIINQIIDVWKCIAAVLQVSVVALYFEAIFSKKPGTYLLAKLRYLETITESAPQWCLQVYIMLRQWHFPSYTIFSTVLSMLSLTWSITILEKERRIQEGTLFRFIDGFAFFNWQLWKLVSRLFSIALFAYVFRHYVIIPLALHWFILLGWILLKEIIDEGSERKTILLSMLPAFPFLFHSSKTFLPVKHAKYGMRVGYALLTLATIIMVTCSLTIEMHDVSHMDVLKPIAIASVAGTLPLSICCYCCVDHYDIDTQPITTPALSLHHDIHNHMQLTCVIDTEPTIIQALPLHDDTHNHIQRTRNTMRRPLFGIDTSPAMLY